MSPSEFKSWIEYHSSAFPDWGTQAIEAMRASGNTRDAWRGVLVGISLETARQATDDMLAGIIKRPFNVEEHIPAIRSRAVAITSATMPVRDTRPQSWRCHVCRDTGFVTVLHGKTVIEAQKGEYDAYAQWQLTSRIGRPPSLRKWYTCAMWCGCVIGERQRDKVAHAGRSDSRQAAWAAMPVYDVDAHVRVTDDIAAMIEQAKHVRPANYVPGFDTFNEREEGATWL